MTVGEKDMGGNKILIGYLESGEAVALQALEISSVPDISIIDSNADETAVIDGYKRDMGNLLSEIYQNYKAQCGVTGQNQDVSLELLWTTEEVVNQPYRAKIRLFLIVRAIGRTPGEASEMTLPVMTALRSTLDLQKYEYRDMDEEELMGCVRAVDDSAVKALVKEETLENLQNQMIPVCYAYDRIPDSGQDLSRIVNSLIDHPGCAVSFQLIPAWLDGNEINELSRMMQLLDTLSKGAVETGNMSFALAEKHAETYRYYTDQKNSALFLYNILIYGNPEAVSNLSSRVYAQINSSDENVNMRFEDLRGDEIRKDANFYPLPWAVNELLMNMDRNMQIWNSGMFSNAYYRLPYIITAEEASQFFRLPVGGSRVSAGLPVNEAGKTNRTYADNIINAGDIEIGTLKSSSRGDKIGISLKDLAKHMLVVGTPGSGKTTFSVSLLDRLWKDHHIPFLVIEPAKNEYRALVQSIPDLQVFTPGKNFISPSVYNPFVPPKNVKL